MKVILALLAAAVLVSALLVVNTRHESRLVFAEIQSLEQRRDALNEEWGRLQLEQSTWAMASRLESLARTKLEMQQPSPEQLVLIPQ